MRDINVIQDLVFPGRAKVRFSLGGETGGQYVSGPQKAVQRYVSLLMTGKGSVFFDPTRGTYFQSAIQGGSIRTDEDLEAYFALASSEVLEYVRDRFADAPEDEDIDIVNVVSASVMGSSAVLVLEFVFVAGSNVTVTLPVEGGI